MKYNPDIALQILKAVEEYPEDEIPARKVLLPKVGEDSYSFHSRLLAEAGYISVYSISTTINRPRQIKWLGVQFLEQFRDDSLWQRTKDEATRRGVGMALDTLFRIGKILIEEVLKQQQLN